jgi:hypothetical protein
MEDKYHLQYVVAFCVVVAVECKVALTPESYTSTGERCEQDLFIIIGQVV